MKTGEGSVLSPSERFLHSELFRKESGKGDRLRLYLPRPRPLVQISTYRSYRRRGRYGVKGLSK